MRNKPNLKVETKRAGASFRTRAKVTSGKDNSPSPEFSPPKREQNVAPPKMSGRIKGKGVDGKPLVIVPAKNSANQSSFAQIVNSDTRKTEASGQRKKESTSAMKKKEDKSPRKTADRK